MHCSRVRNGRTIVFQKVRDQAVDALNFEKQRAARAREKLAEMRGQLYDKNAVQPIIFERFVRFDLAHVHPQRSRDHLLEQRRARLAQRGIIGRDCGRRSRSMQCGRRYCGHCGRVPRRDVHRYSRWSQSLPDHAVASRRQNQLPQPVMRVRREMDIDETLGLQQGFPLLRRQAWAARQAQAFVFVQPPAFQQAESDMGLPGPRADLVDQQDAAALQHRFGVAHGLAHVRRGVQHVGRNDRIVAVAVDRLQRQRFADIEDRSSQRGELRLVGLLRVQQESLGQIGVAVFLDEIAEPAQHRQQGRGRATGSGANLQQAQAAFAARRFRRELGAEAFAQDVVEVIGDQVVLVDAFDQMHRRLGKHHVGRGHGAGQNLWQSAQAGFDQREIGAMVGVDAPRTHRVIPAQPQCFDRLDCAKAAALGLGIGGEKAVAFKMTQRGVHPPPVRWPQSRGDLRQRTRALRVREQSAQLRRHDRRRQVFGIDGQLGGIECGCGEPRVLLGIHWIHVR